MTELLTSYDNATKCHADLLAMYGFTDGALALYPACADGRRRWRPHAVNCQPILATKIQSVLFWRTGEDSRDCFHMTLDAALPSTDYRFSALKVRTLA